MRRASRFALFLLPLTACGGSSSSSTDAPAAADAKPLFDAAPPDASTPFGCLGKPLPTTAPGHVAVTGSSEQISLAGAQPLTGTAVAAKTVSGDTQLATATTDSTGAYTLTLTTGGTPVDGYLIGHHDASGGTTYIDTYLYPPHPIAGDQDKGVLLMLTSGGGGTLGALSGLAGVQQQAGKGMIGVVVADCNGAALAGATITSNPAGTVKYDSGSLPSMTATSTAADGRGYIFNVAPGQVEVSATYNGMTLRAHMVTARADVVTTTAIEP